MCPVYKVIAIWETPQISFETYDLNARSQETLETTLDFIPHFPLFFGYVKLAYKHVSVSTGYLVIAQVV